jgi:hypothetical protein
VSRHWRWLVSLLLAGFLLGSGAVMLRSGIYGLTLFIVMPVILGGLGAWSVRAQAAANPAPMHEWSPYAQVLPKHLHGYLISKQGQFRLTQLGPNRTLLEGTTWYQHGLWPAQYWRLWSDAIIHRIHLRVLTHIKTLSEAEN